MLQQFEAFTSSFSRSLYVVVCFHSNHSRNISNKYKHCMLIFLCLFVCILHDCIYCSFSPTPKSERTLRARQIHSPINEFCWWFGAKPSTPFNFLTLFLAPCIGHSLPWAGSAETLTDYKNTVVVPHHDS